jgi:hypothetical protein
MFRMVAAYRRDARAGISNRIGKPRRLAGCG